MWNKLIHLSILGLGVYAWPRVDLYSLSLLHSAAFPAMVALAAVYAFILGCVWLARRFGGSGSGGGGSRADAGRGGDGGFVGGSGDGGCAGDGGSGCD